MRPYISPRPEAGLDMIKPRNYLIARGLSRIFRFGSVIAAGALLGKELIVELEGIEPSSKRGTNELSTCLVLT